MGLVRLLLACVVLMGHLKFMILNPHDMPADAFINYFGLGLNAGYAVIYFYVISGFLISYVLSHNYSPDTLGTVSFYKNRFVRIFSLYWPLLILISLIMDRASATSYAAMASGIFLFSADWFVAFAAYPNDYFANFPAYINQAWTLGAELTFYMLAPLLVRSLPASACLLIFSAACRFSFVGVYGFHDTWTYHFFPATVMFFLLGHFSRLLWEALPINRWCGIPLLGLSFAISTWGVLASQWDDRNFYISILLFTLSLPGVFLLTKDIRWLNAFGDLSYPLYLTHKVVIGLIFSNVASFGNTILRVDRAISASMQPLAGVTTVIAVVVLAVMASAAVRLLIERPTAWLMRRVLRGVARITSDARLVPAPVHAGAARH